MADTSSGKRVVVFGKKQLSGHLGSALIIVILTICVALYEVAQTKDMSLFHGAYHLHFDSEEDKRLEGKARNARIQEMNVRK